MGLLDGEVGAEVVCGYWFGGVGGEMGVLWSIGTRGTMGVAGSVGVAAESCSIQ